MNNKSKVLFITHHFLHGNGGGCFASRAYINAFASIFDSVTLLYPYKEGMEAQFINPKVDKIPVSYDKPKALKLLDLLLGRIHRYANIKKWIGERKFDLVVFDTSLVSFRLIDYFKRLGCKTIVIHHNYQYEYFRDNTKFPLSIQTLYWCKRYEKEAVCKADLNLTLTNQDIELLKEHYDDGHAVFAKLGVFEYKADEHKIKEHANNTHPIFAITGTLGSYQTYESLYHWIEDYFPIFRKYFPESKLIVAGRNPSDKLTKLVTSNKNVEIIPNPTSMDDILDHSDFYICPTELGGGLKLRIMDGLSHGLPVVTHKVSARGYDDFEEKGYLFSYDSKESFESCMKQLKEKTFNSAEIIKAYQGTFTFEAGVKRVGSIIKLLQ